MKDIKISDNSIEEVFTQLRDQLDGKLTKVGGGYNFKIHDFGIQGAFSGKEFSNSISFIRCKLTLKERLSVLLQPSESSSSLYFIYCNKGKIMHEISEKELYHPIYENQTVVMNPSSPGIKLHLLEGFTQEMILIKMDPEFHLKREAINANLNDNLPGLYKKLNEKDGNTHYGSLNLKVCDHFNQIDSLQHSGLLREVYLEGQIKLILALLLKQCNEDIFHNRQEHSLCSSELKRIKQISNYIDDNYSMPHTVKDLTLKFRVSPSKLQKGFKILYNRTVSNYIKNLRVEIAEDMIKNKECTISEIVYNIGFTSRSYFSKIFKDKYNCSPKDYQGLIKSNRQCLQ